ncbi:MAG: 23S rRNA (adenine(2503)-C(2))-methyltransferase [Gammaproteobacteria bacterium GWF2_41_13]|nr:MAG: 23S rRNA (adenine(2503)-C(2))-methyltransferase [Gammaproteobacteria bacterium GWF2_41_13]
MDNLESKINLLNFDRPSLRAYFTELGEKPFHADQIIQWIHQQGHQTFDQMTNLSKKLRDYLIAHAEAKPPQLVQEQISQDETRKWLLELDDKERIETVYIPEKNRGTLCISSQAGCALKCAFCATGQLGCKRNLTVAEIIGQVWFAVRRLSAEQPDRERIITNVVLMGMGEPLLNFDNVIKATGLMMDTFAYGFSKYRVTLSTVGIVPAIDQLSKISDISLAVSLHAPTDEIRHQIIPVNRRYPLSSLMAACRRYFQADKRRKITFEYVMLKGVNDSPSHAKALVKLLEGIPSKVNLLLFNPVSGVDYQPATDEAVDAFWAILTKAGLQTQLRRRRGSDIAAACGQLANRIKD